MHKQQSVATLNWTFAVLCSLLLIFWIYSVRGNEQPRTDLEIFGFGSYLFCLVAAHISVAVGASRSRDWARITCIILFIPYLFAFPLGTAAAVYAIKNCKDKWIVKVYSQSDLASAWPKNT